MKLTQPNPQTVSIGGAQYKYLAFFYPGNITDVDNVFGIPYLGNSWEYNTFHVKLMGTSSGNFSSAEAAFQASKWWNDDKIRAGFESAKTGDEVFDLRYQLTKNHTYFQGAYGGYATKDEAMYQILLQKFGDQNSELQNALGATGHAYLLDSSSQLDPAETKWSSGNDGKGTNHLGLKLMRVRAHYFPGQGNPLEKANSSNVIMACTTALKAAMKEKGLSGDNKRPTK